MKLLVLFLSCMVAGSFACSDEQCKDPELGKELEEIKFLPNKEQLIRICPKLMTFLECEKDFMECPGQSLEEQTSSSEKFTAVRAQSMLSGISLLRELCDEDSALHRDYTENADCVRGYLMYAPMMCVQALEVVLEKFFEELYPNEGDEEFAEIHCLSRGLELACIVDNMEDGCGADAKNLAMTIMERMKPFLKAELCGDLENSEELKTKLLDFMDFDEDRRSRVQSIFDLIKRRR